MNQSSDSTELARYADEAMYPSEEMPFDVNRGPRVTLLNATHDPLGSNAAMAMIYEGKVARDLSEITRDQRKHYLEQIVKTHLKAPWESVQFHFLIEGVTRSFTHQMVRQRTAVYAQESLRFAVKEVIDTEVALPPSLLDLADDDPRVLIWKKAINGVDDAYHALVDNDIPAEDARGLLPHNITTRLHYVTGLRGLHDHLGNRLCTQAQFEWRRVALGIIAALRNYNPMAAQAKSIKAAGNAELADLLLHVGASDAWQFNAIADLFKPVCYNVGHCVFNADFDRKCSIRERVQDFAKHGVESEVWGDDYIQAGSQVLLPIHPVEWLGDPAAAR